MESVSTSASNVQSIPGMEHYGASPAQHGVIEAEHSIEAEAMSTSSASASKARASASTPEDIAQQLKSRGAEAWRGASNQLQTKASQVSEMAVAYARDEPVKAMLMAAATGALVMVCMRGLTARH